jgi:FKBP-type peptidyl-prolyl cis-trans isomerase
MELKTTPGLSIVHPMKQQFIALALFSSLVVADAADAKTFKDDREKANYAIGVSIGTSFKQQNIEFDSPAVTQGINDALAGSPALTMPEVNEAIKKYQQDRRAQLADKNKKAGEAYLAENKTKNGVVTLASGLQYKIITQGSGDSPKAEDTVTVNYRGSLIDGTEFDSSAKSGKPATFRVGGVIKGWTEALLLMKPGAKWQLFIPQDLAYGEMGRPSIPPGSTLIFDVELVSVQPPPPPPPPPAPLTSDIIKVPSLEEMKKGAKIETIKADDAEKSQKPAESTPGKK